MATKTFVHHVEIKSKKECKAFIRACEAAMKKPSKEIRLSKPYKELDGEDLKGFFSN